MSGAVIASPFQTGHNVDLALNLLADPALDATFWPSTRGNVASAWHGHVPFAHWLTIAMRPRVVVELGTHNGTSYAAFCEAVRLSRLPTRCFAIDTWAGDQHSGFYDETVFNDLRTFHDERYGDFSTLVRSEFDRAVGRFADGSIDLLHIDGVHLYEAVRHDYETWRPKLSDRAVVLFHDIMVKERDFGVWKLWDELRVSHLSFQFPHEYGLGVLVVGANVVDPVRRLCTPDHPGFADRVRQRFAVLADHARVPAHEAIWKELARERDAATEAFASQAPALEAAQREAATQGARAARLQAEMDQMRATRVWRLASALKRIFSKS